MANMAQLLKGAAVALPLALGGVAAQAADIVDTAAGAGSFDTLVAAVQAADLVEVLKGEGPFTVFAPTDEAFAKLPDGTVESLLKPENKEQLVALLTYHVVPGKTMSGDLAGQELEATTVQGAPVEIDATANGVIHVIDTVIMPKM